MKIVTASRASDFPGYRAINGTTERYLIFLNGKRVKNAFAADTDSGVVWRYQTTNGKIRLDKKMCAIAQKLTGRVMVRPLALGEPNAS